MTEENKNEVATTQTLPAIKGSDFVLRPRNLEEALRFAEMIANSDMVPGDYKGKPANVFIAVQMGAEVGLAPMQAIQNIATINGRPSIWGDAALALVQTHPRFGGIEEDWTGEKEEMAAVCFLHRYGPGNSIQTVKRTFSVEDAKIAKLWGKQGPWTQYPKRMLQMRARGFAMRDLFPDALKGLHVVEEAIDLPPIDIEAREVNDTPAPPSGGEPKKEEKKEPSVDPSAKISEERKAFLLNMAKRAGKSEKELCDHLLITSLSDLVNARLNEAIQFLSTKPADAKK